MSHARKSKPSSKRFLIHPAVWIILALSFITACSSHSTMRDPRLTQPGKKVPPDANYTLRTCTQTLVDNYGVIDRLNDQMEKLAQ